METSTQMTSHQRFTNKFIKGESTNFSRSPMKGRTIHLLGNHDVIKRIRYLQLFESLGIQNSSKCLGLENLSPDFIFLGYQSYILAWIHSVPNNPSANAISPVQ